MLELALTMGILSAVDADKQQKTNAKSQQRMLEYNQRQELIEAQNVEQETEAADQRLHDEQSRFRAAQRALYGKSGAAMTAGSPLAVLGETAATHQIESSDLRRQGAAEYNRRISAANSYGYQARVAGNSVNRNALGFNIGNSIINYANSSIGAGMQVATLGKMK